MALLLPRRWRIVEAISGIGYCNPFLPERIELERRALEDRYVEVGPVIQARLGVRVEDHFPNLSLLRVRGEELLEEMRRRLESDRPATENELLVYEDLALFLLYGWYMNALDDLLEESWVLGASIAT